MRPSSVPPPAVDDQSEFARCSINLVPGAYLVWLRFQIYEDSFCGDSHYRYPDLVCLALQEKAIVWKGQTMSNRFNINVDGL